MKTIIPSSLRDIKKMFAREHVTEVYSLFGVEYFEKKTGRKMSEFEALKILAGDY